MNFIKVTYILCLAILTGSYSRGTLCLLNFYRDITFLNDCVGADVEKACENPNAGIRGHFSVFFHILFNFWCLEYLEEVLNMYIFVYWFNI